MYVAEVYLQMCVYFWVEHSARLNLLVSSFKDYKLFVCNRIGGGGVQVTIGVHA